MLEFIMDEEWLQYSTNKKDQSGDQKINARLREIAFKDT